MKIFVKTLKGTSFDIDAQPHDSVTDVKKMIEAMQGEGMYPADQQMLIYQGKILKDGTTLEDNNVAENSFIVIMLSKAKSSSCGTSATAPALTANVPAPVLPMAPLSPVAALTTPAQTSSALVTDVLPSANANAYGQAASNLVSGSSLEQMVQQILDMGGGAWDRDIVIRAMRAAYNNPARAVEYLYSGIPEQAEVPQEQGNEQSANQPPAVLQAVPSGGPNANPLNLFPQGLPGVGAGGSSVGLEGLRNSPQFQALLSMIQANPQILQSILQEIGRHNPQVTQLIQENPEEFLQLINQPTDSVDGDMMEQLADQLAEVPETVTVTPEEHEAIGRLEAMGFSHAVALQAYFACNKNEELAANYLLDHGEELEEQ